MNKQGKVLVVDDEIHIVNIVTIKLRNNGYEVLSAENGKEAFEMTCQDKPDIIVTDFQMPVMTGLELVAKLRQHERTRDIPVIMLLPRHFIIPKKQQEDLQISGCLNKPFSPRELIANIKDTLCKIIEERK